MTTHEGNHCERGHLSAAVCCESKSARLRSPNLPDAIGLSKRLLLRSFVDLPGNGSAKSLARHSGRQDQGRHLNVRRPLQQQSRATQFFLSIFTPAVEAER